MAVKYVGIDTATLYQDAESNKKLLELLWGDHLQILGTSGERTKVKARGKTGFIKTTAISDKSLLEIYFIDVGQGDGILIRTPDNRHIMIDGGYKRASQPSGKNAADFVDWKFNKDYGKDKIELDVMLSSHNDADHYGGLSDLLDAEQTEELDCTGITVEQFYHAGVAWWINPANNKRWLGPTSADGKHLIQLMGKRADVVKALKDDAVPKLQGEWAKFMQNVASAKTSSNTATPISRLSDKDKYIPGFEATDESVAIRVLAPVEKTAAGKPALRNFSSDSKNTNGNSLLLRLDYGRTRILLTGDLNSESQLALLEDYTGSRIEFQCDVAKGCHHGSDDVSYEFLSAMRPAVTVISSGDSEGHDHPRPGIVAASATTGYLEIAQDKIVSPLVYSTEIARSVNLGKPATVKIDSVDGTIEVGSTQLATVTVDALVTKAGDLRPTKVSKTMDKTYIVAGLIYGLVNVRTDGNIILCATMDEKDNSWHIKKLQSRF